MSFAELPHELDRKAHRLFILWRVGSNLYKEAFYQFARMFIGNTGIINTLLIQTLRYQFAHNDINLIRFLIEECGATAINELAIRAYDINVIKYLVKYHGANNFADIMNSRLFPNNRKEDSLHICLIENGADINLYHKSHIIMLLNNPNGGIILNLAPKLLNLPAAQPFIKRHERIKQEIENTCLNYVVSIVLEYVVYEI